MNQILVTEKLYVTPELRHKKNRYKAYFIISIFLVCILTSFYIYAEYDKNKGVETSQAILSDMEETINGNADDTIAKDDVLMVVLNGTDEDYHEIQLNNEQEKTDEVKKLTKNAQVIKTANGFQYKKIATISIPKINVNLAVLQGLTGSEAEIVDLLKISPIKYHGCDPNEVGNFCIAGHNYRNTRFFSKVPTLTIGDKIQLTDLTGRTLTYVVYDKHNVVPEDTRDTTQLTGGKKEVTLITCTDDSKERVIVRCREAN